VLGKIMLPISFKTLSKGAYNVKDFIHNAIRQNTAG